jgi:hypothetical protein
VVLPVASVRGDHFDSGLGELFIEPVGVVSIIRNETLYGFGDEDLCQRLLDQTHFVRSSRFYTHRYRETSAVCHRHDFGPFAALRLAHA